MNADDLYWPTMLYVDPVGVLEIFTTAMKSVMEQIEEKSEVKDERS